MNQEQLRQFGSILKAHLEEAVPESRGLLSSMREDELMQGPMDEADLASARYEREFTLQIQSRNHRLIQEIRGALRRIDSGVYGICLECGQDIGLERLKVQPMTAVCVGCKKALEKL